MLRVLRLLTGWALLVLGGWLAYGQIQSLPSSYKPWEPLNPSIPPGWFTEYKLNRFKDNPAACQDFLQRADVSFTYQGDETVGECELPQQTILQQSEYPYSGTVKATCPLVAALVLWERHVLQPAAQTHLSQPINRVEHFGIFSCRNIRGSTRRSQHASANAIDIGGFRLQGGAVISVRQHWESKQYGPFLRAVHQQSCGLFKSVLGPEYNAAHADHFHLDMGRWGICR